MLKKINEKRIYSFLLGKPQMQLYIEELYALLDSTIEKGDWYLSFREVLIDEKKKETVSFLELRLGITSALTEKEVAKLDQEIADCLSATLSFLLESEGALTVSYSVQKDLEEAFEKGKEDDDLIIVSDGF